MGLIDAEELKKELLSRAFFPALVKHAIEKCPTVDAVEVVRCKDCEHFVITTRTKSKFCNVWCTFQNMSEDNFCSYGERKNNDT